MDASAKGRLLFGDRNPMKKPEIAKAIGRKVAVRPKTAPQLESAQRLGQWWKGKKQTAEHVSRRTAKRRGVPLTEEHKAKISAAKRRRAWV
jgi:hypothetical protein